MNEITLQAAELGALVLQHRWMSAALDEISAALQAGRPMAAEAISAVARGDTCAAEDRRVARETVERLTAALTGGRGLSHDQTRDSLRAAGEQLVASAAKGGARG